MCCTLSTILCSPLNYLTINCVFRNDQFFRIFLQWCFSTISVQLDFVGKTKTHESCQLLSVLYVHCSKCFQLCLAKRHAFERWIETSYFFSYKSSVYDCTNYLITLIIITDFVHNFWQVMIRIITISLEITPISNTEYIKSTLVEARRTNHSTSEYRNYFKYRHMNECKCVYCCSMGMHVCICVGSLDE